jgi:uncharacterized protein (DUF1810 family)
MQTLDRFIYAQLGGRGATCEHAPAELRAGWKSECVAPEQWVFRRALERFYGGQRDALTLELPNQPDAAQ